MGQIVLIYGKSGSGKSRSLKNFAEDEILFINVEKKMLPFRKKFKYELKSDDYRTICGQLSKMPLKTAVIDDAGYLLSNSFMRGHSSGRKGGAVYDLYNDIADSFWGMFKYIKDNLEDDVIIYIIMHEDVTDSGNVKLKTIGKLLDEKVCLEGMVTTCLRCFSTDGKHFFKTSTDGLDITKSPEEMFEKDEIENDLKSVDTIIRNYYGFDVKEDKKDDSEV